MSNEASRPLRLNSPPGGLPDLRGSLAEVWQYRFIINELVRRDLKIRYKNTLGGALYSLVPPLMQIGMLTILMQFVNAKPIHNYSAYLFILFLWNFFQAAIVDGIPCMVGNSGLIKKVYLPRAVIPISSVLGSLVHFGIAFVFTVAYLFALGAYPYQLRPAFLLVVPVVAAMVALSLGLTLALSCWNVFYEDVGTAATTLMRLLFYSMPVFYTIEQVRYKGYYHVYMLNPLAALLVTYQRALLPPPQVAGPGGIILPSVGIPWDYFAAACGISVVTLVAGYWLFEYSQSGIAERL